MMSAIMELPTILVDALKGFNFTGKPLWRLGERLNHVKVELTYKLSQPDNEITNQQTNRTGPLKNQQPSGKRKAKNNDSDSSEINNSHHHLRHCLQQSRPHLPYRQLPTATSYDKDSCSSPDLHYSTTTITGQNPETEPKYCACTNLITDRQSTRTNDDLPS